MRPVARYLFLIAVFAVFACNGNPTMKYELIEYISSGIPSMPQVLTIDSSGRGSYTSHTNEADPEPPEIGRYETVLTAEQAGAVRKVFETLPFESLDDHWGQVRPGEDYRRIKVTTAEGTVEKLIATRLPVNAGIRNLIEALDKVIAQVRSSPRQTLRLEMDSPDAGADGQLEFTITLSNSGTEAIAFPNPVTAKTDSDGAFALQAWPDKDPSELRSGDLSEIRIEKIEVARTTDPASTTAQILKLAPGESITFKALGTSPFKQPGSYVVRASYTNYTGETAEPPLIRGLVFSRKASFKAL